MWSVSPFHNSIDPHSRSLIPEFSLLAIQTLGEEYTNIWLHPTWARSPRIRAALILLPTIPSYLLVRLGPSLYSRYPRSKDIAIAAVNALEVVGEVNLAVFYISGVYYRLVRRLLGVPHVRAHSLTVTCLGKALIS
jgi:peroxin-10